MGVKLVGGFIMTALIILIVGLLSISQQANLQRQAEELGNEAIPAVRDILVVKSEAATIQALMRSLLTTYATREQREQAHRQLPESRAIYGAARDHFMTLPFFPSLENEWREFTTNITAWVGVNNQVVEMSQELMAMDITQPDLMKQLMAEFEIAHYTLLANTSRLVMADIPFEGGESATACTLGRWMDNPGTTNPEILALINQLREPHNELHRQVGRIKNLMANGQVEAARNALTNNLFPASEEVFALFYQINAVVDNASELFVRMNQLLLIDAAEFQDRTFAAIDTMVHSAEELAAASVADAQTIANRGRLITIICVIGGILLAVALGIILTRLITGPLFKGVNLAKAMAEGDLTKTMDVDQKDEIGTLANSLNEMTTSLRRMFGDISQGVSRVDESSVQLAAIANQMSSGSESTATRSGQVAAAAEQMSANQASVAAAMEQASVNVNMVAAAAEEMSATINEIASNSGKAKDITGEAVNQSHKASERVNELGRAADEINKVTEAITEISEQTNLLALNATIEAARAGEAGKGFAVVANEIKDLAKQTAEATLDIKNKIEGIQQATGVTVTEINQISAVIADVDQIVATIASAVEEQSATTKEIAQNVNQASQGITEVNENVAQSSTVAAEIATDIAAVNESANEMSNASSQVKVSAEELATIAEKLKEMVARFKT
nr:methyl-accepting chemotaxis protein [Desulfobulbus alkaliphilus]